LVIVPIENYLINREIVGFHALVGMVLDEIV